MNLEQTAFVELDFTNNLVKFYDDDGNLLMETKPVDNQKLCYPLYQVMLVNNTGHKYKFYSDFTEEQLGIKGLPILVLFNAETRKKIFQRQTWYQTLKDTKGSREYCISTKDIQND